MTKQSCFRLRVQGHLGHHWSEYLGGVDVKIDGTTTIIEGCFGDQAALHGLLAKIGDEGLRLIEVKEIQSKEDEPED